MNFNGGVDGDQAFATMLLAYEPPSAADGGEIWAYNVVYKTAPFSRVDLLVDGLPFNPLTSDTKGAEDRMKGLHVWDIQVEFEADMLQSIYADDQLAHGLQTRGLFTYQGPCGVYVRNMRG